MCFLAGGCRKLISGCIGKQIVDLSSHWFLEAWGFSRTPLDIPIDGSAWEHMQALASGPPRGQEEIIQMNKHSIIQVFRNYVTLMANQTQIM